MAEYIDKDKVMAILKELYVNRPLHSDRWIINDMEQSILRLPAADVRENVSAKWIDMDSDSERYDDIRCSNCKHSYTVDAYRWCDVGFVAGDLKYCPNCGANMRGGKDD